MPCRHLLERANLTACLSLSHTASELAANYADDAVMGELYADVLMNLTTAYAAYGQRQLALKFAEMHMTQRIKVERALNRTPDSEMSFEAMAHTALSLGLILNGRYEEAIKYAAQGRELLKRKPSFVADNYWPHWGFTYHAWALIGLEKYDEALPLILDTLRWRERHFGRDDTESLK
jgi:tetratricopeptide (TPR) repeat protein